ncbi:hydrolase [Thermococcus sp. M39]|uniref:HAD family hydrolase n=1 Tax=unclassified Thermococcus TaxID=2627626 RepID=UPI00143894D5|nr:MULTISPECIES: HAD family hydrolase [unclassified Thermococcus]NJE08652.1 hydrolase [Thermococcus sp. M39]NJE13047.1 hydrolase [Thermococcus sp. LS2]
MKELKWLIFDIDGVLIDVSESYDLATKLTVEYFLKKLGKSIEVELDLIRDLRRKGAFGDDFKVSEALIIGALTGDLRNFVQDFPAGEGIGWVRKQFGIVIDPKSIERIFNTFYLGEYYKERAFDFEGLWKKEKPIVKRELLEKANERFKLGVVTGRSALELELAEKILGFHFENAVTRELYVKPDPKALWHLTKGEEGIYIGDTINDGLLVENYKKAYGKDFGFLMVGGDVKDVNEAIEKLLDAF